MTRRKILILAPYPKGKAPSQRFRFEQYLAFLENVGFQYEYHSFIDDKLWSLLYKKGRLHLKFLGFINSFFKRFLLMFRLRQFDFIFIHREVAQIGPPFFEWLIAKIFKKPFIYDFDDAIWLPNYSASNASFHRLKAYWKVKFIMKWADKITAGNTYLKNYARQYNGNILLLPTTIDTFNHHNKTIVYKKQELIRIGWTGTHTTMHYLNDLFPILDELYKKVKFKFLVISNEKPLHQAEYMEYVRWNKETEIEDLLKIDVGVMPLKKDKWSEGKCGFKGLQYMSLGIPTIMSPVGVNLEIINHSENGFLCDNPNEWKSTIQNLIEDHLLRERIGLCGKNTVENKYSVNANKAKFINLFS